MAVSRDGFIADEDGGVGWLEPFNSVDCGYEQFIYEISTLVMGRKSYDQACSFSSEWVYAGKTSIVVTSQPLHNPPPDVSRWDGSLQYLIRRLRGLNDGDIWIMGGAQLQGAMFDLGALNRMELFVIPVALGKGIPLLPTMDQLKALPLISEVEYGMGIKRLEYGQTREPSN